MDALEAIFNRRSVSQVLPDPLPRAQVEKLLLAAVQAPNHYHVRPWRFVVLQGESRKALGEVMAQSLLKEHSDLPESALEKERSKPLRAPVLIAIFVDYPADPRVIELENISSVAAAVENLLIAAAAEGLGAMWRTGPAARDPEVKKFFGFPPDQTLLGFVYVGYPAMTLPAAERPSFEDRTTWRE